MEACEPEGRFRLQCESMALVLWACSKGEVGPHCGRKCHPLLRPDSQTYGKWAPGLVDHRDTRGTVATSALQKCQAGLASKPADNLLNWEDLSSACYLVGWWVLCL